MALRNSQNAVHNTMRLKVVRKRARLPALLLKSAMLTIVMGFLVAGYQLATNRINDVHIAQEIDRANRGQPSSMPATIKPADDEFAKYSVAPDAPRYIFIPKIAVKAMVKPMGLTADNHIQAPANVHYAGWFAQSSKPGGPGAMVIDGHVANWATKSVFHDLKSLAPGDQITIERGDGAAIMYRVAQSHSFPADDVDMKAALLPIGQKPGLNLITCDGAVVKGNKFDKRLVVFAEQQ